MLLLRSKDSLENEMLVGKRKILTNVALPSVLSCVKRSLKAPDYLVKEFLNKTEEEKISQYHLHSFFTQTSNLELRLIVLIFFVLRLKKILRCP